MLFILEDSLSLVLFESSWLSTVETFTFYSFSGSCFLSFMIVTMCTNAFAPLLEFPDLGPVSTQPIYFTLFLTLPRLFLFFFSQDLAQPFHHWKHFSFSQQIHTNHQSMCKTRMLQSYLLVIYQNSACQTSLELLRLSVWTPREQECISMLPSIQCTWLESSL